jgi:hypothetical protein
MYMAEWRYSSTNSSALDGGELLASHPGFLNLGERAPSTQWLSVRVFPGAGLKSVKKRKIVYPCRKWNPYSSNVKPVARRCTD